MVSVLPYRWLTVLLLAAALLCGCSEDELKTASPVLNYNSGSYTASFYLNISCPDPDAVIRYSTNGTAPDESSGQLYTTPFLVNTNMTVHARAFKTGDNPSDAVSANFTFNNTDAYDSGDNRNDSSATAATLGDLDYTEASGPSSVQVKGYIEMIRPDRDFFYFYAVDPVFGSFNWINESSKKFHIRIKFLQNPEDAYGIRIVSGRSGDNSGTGVYPNTTPTPGAYSPILRQFDWGLRVDSTAYPGNFDTPFTIEVVKHEPIKGTNHMYILEISNGKYVGDFDLE